MIARIWEELMSGELVFVREANITVDDVRNSEYFLTAIADEDYHYDFVIGEIGYHIKLDGGKIVSEWCCLANNPFQLNRESFDTVDEFCEWLERLPA